MNKPQLFSMPCGCKLCSSSVSVADDKCKVNFKVWFEMCPMHERAEEMKKFLAYAHDEWPDGKYFSTVMNNIGEFLRNLAEEEKKKAEKFSTS